MIEVEKALKKQASVIYCDLFWGGAANIHMNKLLILQKKAVSIMAQSEYLVNTEVIFRLLSILEILEVYKYSCCMYVFNHKKIIQIKSYQFL